MNNSFFIYPTAQQHFLTATSEEVAKNSGRTVRMMDDTNSSPFSRRPGDGGSEENSARSSYASEVGGKLFLTLKMAA